jgi:hypothetical protein
MFPGHMFGELSPPPAPYYETTHRPSPVHLFVVFVVRRSGYSNPLPRVIFHEILETPEARSEPRGGFAPDVCVRKDRWGE